MGRNPLIEKVVDRLSLQHRISKLAERRLGIKELNLAGTAVQEERSDFGQKWAGLGLKSYVPGSLEAHRLSELRP